ncbi:MAG: sigma factor, partial [Candidatus Binatia bacterium]
MATGDQQAVALFYDQTCALVFGLALRIVGEPSTAEDVVLEVYTQAWRQAAEYDPARGRPTAWLLN